MYYDLLTLGILAVTTIRGAAKGIAWQLAAIAALVLCFVFATPLSIAIAPYIKLDPPLNRWVAMLGIYLVFSFATFATARTFRGWLEKERFVEYDRHLGAVFGLVKGVTLSLVLTFFVVAMSEKGRSYILHTYTGYAAAKIMDGLHPIMPEELHDVLEPYIHELDQPGMELHYADDVDRPEAEEKNRGSRYRPVSPASSSRPVEARGGIASGDPFEHDPLERAAIMEPEPAVPSLESELEQLVRNLPGLAEGGIRNLVLEALKNTSPQDRDELVHELRSGAPTAAREVAQSWRHGRPAPAPQRDTSRERKLLTAEICDAFTSDPQRREDRVTEIETALAGVPDQVSLAVLGDWHADLLGRDPDPNPDTDVTTAFDVRIVQELERARVPRQSLSRQLRDRLDAVERR